MNKSNWARSWFRSLELSMFAMIALDFYNNAVFWSVWVISILLDTVIDLKEDGV